MLQTGSDERMGKTRRRLKAVTAVTGLVLLAAVFSGCALPEFGQSEAVLSFKKEVKETRDALVPSLIDAVANRDPRAVRLILDKQCALAREKGRPFACGITVLDLHGITLASATPVETMRRLNYSRYEVVMQALKDKKIVTAKLYLQDGSALYVVGIPLARSGKAQGLLVLTFDAGELKNRVGITEQEFLQVDLNR
jgi:hypothetical protein